MSEQAIKVYLCDESELVYMGLKALLERSSSIQVVGSPFRGKENALSEIVQSQPNVVLLDVQAGGSEGLSFIARIKESVPGIRVLVLTGQSDVNRVQDALRNGADGYCLKSISGIQLELAIKCVAAGAGWLDAGIAPIVFSQFNRGGLPIAQEPGAINATLSKRESEVLELIVEGLSNQEIANRLGLSKETVKAHIRRLFEKMAVRDRTQAAMSALKLGIAKGSGSVVSPIQELEPRDGLLHVG